MFVELFAFAPFAASRFAARDAREISRIGPIIAIRAAAGILNDIFGVAHKTNNVSHDKYDRELRYRDVIAELCGRRWLKLFDVGNCL